MNNIYTTEAELKEYYTGIRATSYFTCAKCSRMIIGFTTQKAYLCVTCSKEYVEQKQQERDEIPF